MITKRIVTGLFLAALVFESLNWIGVLHFHLDFTWLGLVGTSAVILALLFYVDPEPAVWVAAFAGTSADFISDITNLYNHFSWWDRIIHTFGGFCTAVIVYYLLRMYERRGVIMLRGASIIYATIFTVSFLGFVYEYWEYLVDFFYFQHQKEQGDAVDTVDDMILNILGASLFLLVIILWRRFQNNKKLKAQEVARALSETK